MAGEANQLGIHIPIDLYKNQLFIRHQKQASSQSLSQLQPNLEPHKWILDACWQLQVLDMGLHNICVSPEFCNAMENAPMLCATDFPHM